MHEVSQRWALTTAVIAAIVGVVALILGAFIAPIPQQTTMSPVSGSQVITAIFIRGIVSLIALAAAFVLAYYGGYRIQATFEPTANPPKSQAAASSALFALFTTPGPRRDATYAGAITLIAYWFFTTIYIAALGRSIGGIGQSGDVVSFLVSRIFEGLALTAAGAGAGGLGARNAVTRGMTRRIFASAPATPATEIAVAESETKRAEGE